MIDNLISFWTKKVYENKPKFYSYQPLIKIIEEIDPKIYNIQSKKISVSQQTPNINNTKETENNSNSHQVTNSNNFSSKGLPFLDKVKEECKNELQIDEDEGENEEFHKMKSKTIVGRLNRLESSLFHIQDEKPGKNILTLIRKKKTIIGYIDIDLFLQRIALGESIYDNIQDNDCLFRGFCLQHTTFISAEILIPKIISCFHFFYQRYTNQYNDQNDKMKVIPFAIVDLILYFVEVHNKFSKSIMNDKIIILIDNFYNRILEINEITSRFKDEITESQLLLNSIKDGKNYRRSLTLKGDEKLPYEAIKLPTVDNKIRDSNIQESFFNIFSYESKEIAIELTRITYKIYTHIDPKEFFKGVFTKKNKFVTSPNICLSIDRFNKLSSWVIEEILAYDYANDRAKVIEKFIDIANELKNLNNFNDCMSIVSGLGTMIVTQLIKTWKSVSNSKNKVLLQIKKLLNFEDNYRNLREEIQKCVDNKIPFIPFMGIYNKRICFLEEYGPYIKEQNLSLVNVDKIVLVQQNLDKFYDFLKVKYNFIAGFDKRKAIFLLQCLQPPNEDELDKLSSYIEPNFILREKKRHNKRATNSEIHFQENYEKLKEIY